MTKRQLNNEEKKFTEDAILRLEQEQDWLNFQIKYNELMIDTGLYQNFVRQRNTMKEQIKNSETTKKENTFCIENLKKQLKEGVEEKETKENKTESKGD